MKKMLWLIALFCVSTAWVQAIEYKAFSNPEQEATYNELIDELRCLVCQNQTIADSNADLAKDLRQKVYEMLQRGQSREQIVEFMTQRYGDFVLYNPPFKAKTGLLWLAPVIFLLLGLLVMFFIIRRRNVGADASRAPDESVQQKAHQLLQKGD